MEENFRTDSGKSPGFWTIPNLLSLSRLPLGLMVIFLINSPIRLYAIFTIFVVAGITDFLDGYLARKWNQTSKIGRRLDPACDKAFVVEVLIAVWGRAWAPLAWGLVGIEAFFLLIAAVGYHKQANEEEAKPTELGKWKMAVECASLGAFVLGLVPLGNRLLAAAIVLAIASGIQKGHEVYRGRRKQ
jgi:cardiolipin synthase